MHAGKSIETVVEIEKDIRRKGKQTEQKQREREKYRQTRDISLKKEIEVGGGGKRAHIQLDFCINYLLIIRVEM